MELGMILISGALVYVTFRGLAKLGQWLGDRVADEYDRVYPGK